MYNNGSNYIHCHIASPGNVRLDGALKSTGWVVGIQHMYHTAIGFDLVLLTISPHSSSLLHAGQGATVGMRCGEGHMHLARQVMCAVREQLLW